MSENKSLLLFSIGPVQSFIAEARRTRDLWVGSQMLVEISKAAIQTALTNGAQLCFPAAQSFEGVNVPNVFAAIVPKANVVTIAKACEDAARGELFKFGQNARQALQSHGASWDDKCDQIWNRQLQHHLEIYWVACEQPTIEDDIKTGEGLLKLTGDQKYGDWYNFVRLALDARKRSRCFARANEESMKDSLSGQREALHLKGKDAKEYWSKVYSRLHVKMLLQEEGRERLDALGVIKRFWQPPENATEDDTTREARFPSVSSIAVADFLRRVKSTGNLEKLEEYEKALAPLEKDDVFRIPRFNLALPNKNLPDWHYDGDFFYPEALNAERIERDYLVKLSPASKQALPNVREKLNQLYKSVEYRPSSYYAIMAMDGDSMGKHVGACPSQSNHLALSERLAELAKNFPDLLQQNYTGRVVYAGGDDLLAFLPMREALPAASAVRQAFVQSFRDWPIEALPGYQEGHPTPFTASIGIVFAHHRSPLDLALQEARRAEQAAKSEYGRDAVCVVAIKRSGETIRVGAKWEAGGLDTLAIIDHLRRLFEPGDGLSSKFAFDAKQAAPALVDLPEAFCSELKYLIKRHGPQLSEDFQEVFPLCLSALARQLEEPIRGDAERDPKRRRGAIELANWLLLARFIAEGGVE